MANSDESSRKYTISAKVDLDTQTTLIDYANKCTGGSVSNAINGMIHDWFELVHSKQNSQTFSALPSTVKRKIMEYTHKKRERIAIEQSVIWQRLQSIPDDELETVMRAEAEENSLPWPPQNVVRQMENAEESIRQTLRDAITDLWDENAGVITFRDISRRFASYPLSVLWEYMDRLQQEEFLVITESSRNSYRISRPDVFTMPIMARK
jgi:hypothetical protein